MLPCRTSVDLTESFKQMFGLSLGEPSAGIDDLEFDKELISRKIGVVSMMDAAANEDFTLLREFDSVTDDVKKDLPNPEDVPFDLSWDGFLNNVV